MNTKSTIIEVRRTTEQDASTLVAQVARAHGTCTIGNMRWRGGMGPHYRDIGTQDGRTIRIMEPDPTI